MLEIMEGIPLRRPRPRVALFDFDGTISTLRSGWEEVMSGLMTDVLFKQAPLKERAALAGEIAGYIADSTGIQTIFQMEWLADQVKGRGGQAEDPWAYKAEYNRRLMEKVSLRRSAVESGQASPAAFLIAGAKAFLAELARLGLELYVASGTDEPDVVQEAKILGVDHFFTKIAGAPPSVASCSKELILDRLVRESGYRGAEIVVIGDGKVEIELARQAGALALGLASYDTGKKGVNQAKYQRLAAAGAQAITADFTGLGEILAWLFEFEEGV